MATEKKSTLELLAPDVRRRLVLLAFDLCEISGSLAIDPIAVADAQQRLIALPPVEREGLAEIFRTAALLVDMVELIERGGEPPKPH